MSKTVHLWSMCVWLLVLSGGCASRLANFHVQEITAVEVHHMDEQGFDMTVRTRVENPNRIAAELHDIRFQAASGDRVLGRGNVADSVADSIAAPARSTFDLNATVRVQFTDLPADLPARIADGFLPLTVKAQFAADTRIGRFDMRLTATGRTAIARALQVMITGGVRSHILRVTRLTQVAVGLTGLRLRLRVAVHNAFPFAIFVRGGRIELALGQRRAGVAYIDEPLTLPPRAQQQREFDITISHGDMLRAMRSVWEGDLSVTARGTLNIDPIGGVDVIPFDVRADPSVIVGL